MNFRRRRLSQSGGLEVSRTIDGREACSANKGVAPFQGMGASVARSTCFNDMIGVVVGRDDHDKT
jgi:hypothetical protein